MEINNAESADEAEETAESAEANNTAEVTQVGPVPAWFCTADMKSTLGYGEGERTR